jgi:hypothetical protein
MPKPGYQHMFYWLAGILNIVFFSSCTEYYFSRPQPIDKKNIHVFPKELRGKWTANDESGDEWFEAGKNYGMYIVSNERRVVAGAWPRVDDSGIFIYPLPYYNTFQTIKYDSLKKPIDTIPNYIIHGDLIFEKANDGRLENGCRYFFTNDTIHITGNDTIRVELGQNAFLRKLNQNFYVLNIRNYIMGKDNDWWQLTILQINDDRSITMLAPSGKLGTLPFLIYGNHTGDYVFYFDPGWSSADLLKLIGEGYFQKSNELVNAEKK